jgi:crossover junction endodeoxyribonuclease RuvC
VNVFGIDPGTRHTGYGIVRRVGTRLIHVDHGVLSPKSTAPLCDRLAWIFDSLTTLLESHRPDAVSLEGIFFAKDAQAAAKLGHARGVIMLACARAGLPIFEYPPARVKRAVTGHGRSEKSQVAQMMRALLNLKEVPLADAADALAIAVCHLNGSNGMIFSETFRGARTSHL